MTAKSTILIVDREKVRGDLLANLFPTQSYDVFIASSSDEGRKLADLHVPDLTIIDPAIPDGFHLIDSLHSNQKTKILALSSNAEALAQARERKMDLVVEKDEGPQSLVDAIHAAGFPIGAPGNGRPRILVVDDTADMRMMVGDFLAHRGYNTIMAASGHEALDIVDNGPPVDLVLLDIMMPELGGVEVLSQIMKKRPKMVVVMFSAIHDREIASRTLQLGAFDYVPKPVDLEVLDGIIAAGLTHAEYTRQSWWKRFGA
jgi:DNA-binding response OmpR family regulator